MHLKAVPVTNDFKEMKKLSALAEEAFSDREYISPERAIAMARLDMSCDFLALYDEEGGEGGDEEIFVGFMVVMKYKTMAYLDLLAVQADLREHGYGHAALVLLGELYDPYHLVMDTEMIDVAAKHHEKQEFRRHFYLENGYRSTGFFVTYHGLSYEIFTRTEEFDLNEFENLILRVKLRLLHDVQETRQRTRRAGDLEEEAAVPVEEDECLPPEIEAHAGLDEGVTDGMGFPDDAFPEDAVPSAAAAEAHPASPAAPVAVIRTSSAGTTAAPATPKDPAPAPAEPAASEGREHEFAFGGEDATLSTPEGLAAPLESEVVATHGDGRASDSNGLAAGLESAGGFGDAPASGEDGDAPGAENPPEKGA